MKQDEEVKMISAEVCFMPPFKVRYLPFILLRFMLFAMLQDKNAQQEFCVV